MSSLYVSLDTETGGLDSKKHSLLTLSLVTANSNFDIISSEEWCLRPDDGCYMVTTAALKINKIDIAIHDKMAIPYSGARVLLFKHLRNLKTQDKQLVLVGQSINFDISFLQNQMNVDFRKWQDCFLCRDWIDTVVIANFFKLCGILPSDMSIGLTDLAIHYGISVPEEHTATGDATTVLSVIKAMKKDLVL